MSPIAPTLQAFFTERLAKQRQASPRTVASYRDSLKLLLGFAQSHTGTAPTRLDWTDLDADLIAAFLDHLENDRHNSPRTRNLRLTAIRSLFAFAALRHPEHAEVIQRVLAIPAKRFDKQLIAFLTAAEIDALVAAQRQTAFVTVAHLGDVVLLPAQRTRLPSCRRVSAKRRKEALAGITPRRLDFLGNVVEINRERDGFTRVPVSLGHCEEPQNVAMGGNGCMLSHACESCPFFRVDPLEREGMIAKRFDLKVQLERATVIGAPQHMIDHFHARIQHCDTIIDGIDAYLAQIPDAERTAIESALESMADIRRRASTPRRIDLRTHLREAGPA
ncbi:MAG: integrase/recombinase XerC [Mycobacterium sp.]|jgi:hypothetical protein|nr:integrase/recombinase XerC [Mycobacterium sp.]